jgi:hypothetical protein
MKRLSARIVTSGLLAGVLVALWSGVAEARIALNHNETVLRDEH